MDQASSISRLEGARLRAGLVGSSFYNGDGILSIGESVGATYPFTGEGIGKAMETGSLAARQVMTAMRDNSRAPLREFAAMVEEQLKPRYLGYSVAQRWISQPWLCDLVAMRVRWSEELRGKASGIINETNDPRSVFTWRLLLPQWMRWSVGTRSS
jgi:flavin-dependent dehydrogenase